MVAPAFWTLGVWVELLKPHVLWARGETLYEALTNVFSYLCSVPVSLVLWSMHYLCFDDSQRAEYFADLCGAETSGTDAFVSMLTQLLHRRDLEMAMHAIVVKKEPGDVLGNLANRARTRSSDEIARAITAAAEEESSLDETHPPTGLRIRLLRSRPARFPKLRLESRENTDIDEELSAAAPPIDRALRLRYRTEVLGQ